MGASFIKNFPQAPLNIHSMCWNTGGGWGGNASVAVACSVKASLLRVWGWVVATFCQEGNWEVDAQLCLSRGPAHFVQAQACLISNSWAAFVAWPNFCILCAYTETLNYLSSLPFNKFILECFDWRKLQMKLKLQIRKLHSEVQILGFWLNMGQVG